jgi:hypothetical protein
MWLARGKKRKEFTQDIFCLGYFLCTQCLLVILGHFIPHGSFTSFFYVEDNLGMKHGPLKSRSYRQIPVEWS